MMRAKELIAATLVVVALAGCGGGGGSSGGTVASSVTGNNGGSGGFNPGGGVGGTGGTTATPTSVPGKVFAFVSSFKSDAVDVYDVATQQVVTNIVSFGGPTDLEIDSAKTAVFVPHLRTKEIESFDPSTYASKGLIDLSQAPMSQHALLSLLDPVLRVGYAPTGIVEGTPGKLYVPAMFSVTVVQGGLPVKGLMDLDLHGGNANNLFDLLGADINSLGAFRAAAKNGKVYVTNFLSGTVTVIDTATDDVVANLPVGRGPAGIAIDKLGTAWVACALSGEVWPIDTATNAVGFPVTAGVGPIDVACDPNLGFVYVSNFLSGDISQIDSATQTVWATLPASNIMSLMNAMGMNQATMQNMLNQMLAGLGSVGSGGGTSTGAFAQFLQMLLGGSGAGGTGSGGAIAGIMGQLVNSFFQQLGGSGGNMPSAGIWGIGVSEDGSRVVVANAITGEVGFIDPAMQTVTTIMPGLMSGTLSIPMETSVHVLTK